MEDEYGDDDDESGKVFGSITLILTAQNVC